MALDRKARIAGSLLILFIDMQRDEAKQSDEHCWCSELYVYNSNRNKAIFTRSLRHSKLHHKAHIKNS